MTPVGIAKRILRRFPPAVWLNAQRRRYQITRGFKQEFASFQKLAARSEPRFSLEWQDRYPCLADKTATTDFDRHYIYHTAWAARVVGQVRPAAHVDISSTLYFCSIVSAFVPVRFYDYRPADLRLDNLSSERADLTHLPFADKSIASISCMHVVEHVGLGRYGDPLDPDADLRAMSELRRVVAPGGSLLFVVPVGRPKIMFNAHRIYACQKVIDCFAGLKLTEFALIPDHPAEGGLIRSATKEQADRQTYACGCFWFTSQP